MRIIAGSLKGRRLKAPAWDGLRPTSDRLRETLFNILAQRIPGARVLDGYAGTGAVGIEARSRGAADVVFVEQDPRAASLVAENLAHCGLSEGCAIIRADIGRIQRLLGARRFDLILLDPPYAEPDLEATVARAGEWLAAGGLIVLEHARRRSTPVDAGGLMRTRVVNSGDSALSFYERNPAADAAGGEGRPPDHDPA
jgi:16S rRNA (guanine966-N2)-methyltransferase